MSKKNKIIVSISIVIVIIIIVSSIIGVGVWYQQGKQAVKKQEGQMIRIEIEEKSGIVAIAELLENKGIIRNANVMKIYLKLNPEKSSLKAGKYELNNSENLETILTHIQKGEVVNEEVKITFIEGKNMRSIAKAIAAKTNHTEEEVFQLLEDKEYINSLIEKYWFLTDVIQDDAIYYPLEGYLLPDTYSFENEDVSIRTIFNVVLNYTDAFLSKYKDKITNVHELMTLASIAELEGVSEEDRKEIVGVLIHRLEQGMSLGSDVTAYYAFKVDMGERDLYVKEIKTENPYNTRGPNMDGKLPIGPVCNPSKNAILATLSYTKSDNLYFVADKNKKVYFTKTYEEHTGLVRQLKEQGLWYEY